MGVGGGASRNCAGLLPSCSPTHQAEEQRLRPPSPPGVQKLAWLGLVFWAYFASFLAQPGKSCGGEGGKALALPSPPLPPSARHWGHWLFTNSHATAAPHLAWPGRPLPLIRVTVSWGAGLQRRQWQPLPHAGSQLAGFQMHYAFTYFNCFKHSANVLDSRPVAGMGGGRGWSICVSRV